jgi:hypothetical protein
LGVEIKTMSHYIAQAGSNSWSSHLSLSSAGIIDLWNHAWLHVHSWVWQIVACSPCDFLASWGTFFCFGGTGVSHLRHTSSPFCCGCFGDRVSLCFCAQLSLHSILFRMVFHHNWDGKHALPHPAFFSWDGVSQTFWLGWPGTVIFWISPSLTARDDRCLPPCPAIDLVRTC